MRGDWDGMRINIARKGRLRHNQTLVDQKLLLRPSS
jgi:hypothetical protein